MSATTWGMVATIVGLATASGVLSGLRRMRRAVAAAGVDLRSEPAAEPLPPSTDRGTHGPHVGAVYFGQPWGVPALDGATQAPTPTGQPCATCGVPIAASDQGWLRPALRAEGGRTVAEVVAQHRECELLGIVGQTFGACDCYGFDTSRASALELWRHIHHHRSAETENDHG